MHQLCTGGEEDQYGQVCRGVGYSTTNASSVRRTSLQHTTSYYIMQHHQHQQHHYYERQRGLLREVKEMSRVDGVLIDTIGGVLVVEEYNTYTAVRGVQHYTQQQTYIHTHVDVHTYIQHQSTSHAITTDTITVETKRAGGVDTSEELNRRDEIYGVE